MSMARPITQKSYLPYDLITPITEGNARAFYHEYNVTIPLQTFYRALRREPVTEAVVEDITQAYHMLLSKA